MKEHIATIEAVRAEVREKAELASPFVAVALQGLGAAVDNLRNEELRLEAIAKAKAKPTKPPGAGS